MAKQIGKGLLFVLLALLAAGSVFAQAEDQEQAATPVEPERGTEAGLDEALPFTAYEDETEGVDEILQEEVEMLAGEGYFYDPGNRRDPFKSLLAARERFEFRGPRPEGIPGLLIDEIDLTGIFVTQDGPVAQVASADRDMSYLLRIGDQLYDGDVISITAHEAVFKQIVDDPTALKPFREVVKKLNP